jgi:hypothetical protein
MAQEQTKQEEDFPKWDVALEALVREENKKLERPLLTEDFLRLAKEHAIRFDDIMDTVLRMVILGAWVYTDDKGETQAITQQEFDKMYEGGRLKDEDLHEYTGSWVPTTIEPADTTPEDTE